MSRILFDSRIKKYAYCEPSEIYRAIGASPDGLPIEQIESMREKYGKNSFNERKMIRRCNDCDGHLLTRFM